ncbi:hypothetical protein HIM_01132 [Hirsutella minnesotensis 3608]|nr:hypothetical protein HIM_01132 [Hirsutella minnesotensis 3608]
MVGKAKAKSKTPSASSTRASKNGAASPLPSTSATTLHAQDTKDQQRLLNLFSDAFAHLLSSDEFPGALQEIKQALFNRDFAAAFATESKVEAYAARWSPTRALCYAGILLGIRDHLEQILSEDQREATPVTSSHDEVQGNAQVLADSKTLRVLSVGGCAAEQIAFASFLSSTARRGTLILLDSAPWSHVIDLLQNEITSAPALSKYASAAAKASNRPLLRDSHMSTTFFQHDVLSLPQSRLAELLGMEPLLVTLLFTLNELYTNGGLSKTTKFLQSLGETLPSQSLLLVVDSPGSYSEAAVGKDKKCYPMQWLLNHTLLDTETPGCSWEKLESHDSIWFRLPEELSYPIQLENMRYQMHLYRLHKT